jgi:hypothetical protein
MAADGRRCLLSLVLLPILEFNHLGYLKNPSWRLATPLTPDQALTSLRDVNGDQSRCRELF